jgi:formate hydrogenlyase subunit 3/multisubunit Na+/H+ antiporter MnhD subunit
VKEHQKQTAFLQQCLRYENTAERARLEERIIQVQRDERCVRRAVWLMVMLAALAMAGLCYAGVFMVEYPVNASQLATRLVIKILSALGLGSLACLLAFLGLGVVYRRELDQRREDCRQLALQLLESRLGPPPAFPATAPGTITGIASPSRPRNDPAFDRDGSADVLSTNAAGETV